MFEMGAKFDDTWQSDNKNQAKKKRTPAESQSPERHRLWIQREKRRGKWVTLCGPFSLAADNGKTLLKALKKELGAGGTWKETTLEIQGDKGEALKSALKRRGFRFR